MLKHRPANSQKEPGIERTKKSPPRKNHLKTGLKKPSLVQIWLYQIAEQYMSHGNVKCNKEIRQ